MNALCEQLSAINNNSLFIRRPLIIDSYLCIDSIPYERKRYLRQRNTMDLFIPICF